MATRTWVSGLGDDANPGSRTAPCKTFAGAISKTTDGGEINVTDPGGFGAVTIVKSVTIDGTGNFASVLTGGTSAIIINGAGINVTLRGLSINGGGPASGSLSGVHIVAANRVTIEDCQIFGFTGGVARGVDDTRAAGGKLFITNTTIRDNGQSGVVILPSAGSTAIQAFLDRVRLQGNGNAGLSADVGSRVTIRHAFVAGNASYGLYSASSPGTSELNVETCVVAGNGTGLFANNGGTIRISNVHVTNNATGLGGPGTYATHGNNRISGNAAGNSVPGAPAPIGAQ